MCLPAWAGGNGARQAVEARSALPRYARCTVSEPRAQWAFALMARLFDVAKWPLEAMDLVDSLAMPPLLHSGGNLRLSLCIIFCKVKISFACAPPRILIKPSKNSSSDTSPSPSSSMSNKFLQSSCRKSSRIHFFLSASSRNDAWNSSKFNVPLPSTSISANMCSSSLISFALPASLSAYICSLSHRDVSKAFSTMIAVTRFIRTRLAIAM
mmetsp:Transcript_82705/g.230001  ORF Transcript_82705/g.230001 Transcript_82705/m.230001 type:complete len:211 (+) Transcript_82705:205-837(+)